MKLEDLTTEEVNNMSIKEIRALADIEDRPIRELRKKKVMIPALYPVNYLEHESDLVRLDLSHKRVERILSIIILALIATIIILITKGV